MKLEVEPTREWYEFDIRKEGEKYYIEGEWEMFISIYNIKQGDELRFVIGTFIHENLTVGHIRRKSGSGGIALPRCTIGRLCSHFTFYKLMCSLGTNDLS
jgi:hypothetical protein